MILRPGGDGVVPCRGAAGFELPYFRLIVKKVPLRFVIARNFEERDRPRALWTLNDFLEQITLVQPIDQTPAAE